MAKESPSPVIHVSHVNLSETLAPYHLHIRNHLILMAPTLASIAEWNPIPIEKIAETGIYKRDKKFQPLTILAPTDVMASDAAFHFIAQEHPFITVKKINERAWDYRMFCLPLKDLLGNACYASISKSEGREYCNKFFRDFDIIATPRD